MTCGIIISDAKHSNDSFQSPVCIYRRMLYCVGTAPFTMLDGMVQFLYNTVVSVCISVYWGNETLLSDRNR
jgi:hypothetical protein